MVCSERIPVDVAAYILGMHKQAVRVQMQRGRLKIGAVDPPGEKGGHRNYRIYRGLLEAYIGRELSDDYLEEVAGLVGRR
ncbi:MAG: hypothetical protein LUE23_05305 [Lachnospiraceae bacterium]|nr:hypothetical protein [Lachnospiraceae bacterium]